MKINKENCTDNNSKSINKKFVQSFIANITFPNTIQGVFDMIEKNTFFGDLTLDIDLILNYYNGSDVCWSAPRWISKGDILFFYQGVTAKSKIQLLLKEAIKVYSSNSKLISILSHANTMADKYIGTIFACASVGEDTIYLKDEDRLQHFRSTIFAPLDEVYIFENPLPKDELYKYVKINRQGSITSLFGDCFINIKEALSERNALPNFLIDAYQAEDGFYSINDNNWITISCSKEARFVNEAQVRGYFIDYLLRNIKDRRTPILEECNCYRDNKRTGIADYFIKINNQWLPVEAKFNLSFEEDIVGQIKKYMDIDSIIPTVGNHRTMKIDIDRANSDRCLIIDKYGIYTYVNGKVTHNFNNPLVKRNSIEEGNLNLIRNKIIEELNLG